MLQIVLSFTASILENNLHKINLLGVNIISQCNVNFYKEVKLLLSLVLSRASRGKLDFYRPPAQCTDHSCQYEDIALGTIESR